MYLSYETYYFFQKNLKSNEEFENVIKMEQKVFGFVDNCIWIGTSKFSLLLQSCS